MLLFIVFLVVIALLLERASLQEGLTYLSYDCKPDRLHTEPGQAFTLITTVTNRRRLPVAFLRLEELLPDSADIEGEGLSLRRDASFLRLISTAFLMPKEILTRKISISLPTRGRYIFHGAHIYAGDFLGLREKDIPFRQNREIVVYPPPSKEQLLPRVLGGYFGEHSVRRFILEDPILTLGFRDYTGREPQRYISWSRSLAKGRLMARQFDHTQDYSVTLLLNTDCGGFVHQDHRLIEEAFSLTRSVCEYLESRKIRYCFLTNATTAGALGQWDYLSSGLGPRHFYTIMEGLGRATYDRRDSCAGLFKRAEKGSEQDQAFIVVSPLENPGLPSMMKRLESATGRAAFLLTANPDAAREEAPA